MRPARPLRALLLLVLLSASTLLPQGVAQETTPPAAQPTICFPGREASLGQTGRSCAGVQMIHALQGDSITIAIQSATQLDVSVRCVRACPPADPSATSVYWATYRGSELVFPRDFREPGPNRDGGDAVADKAPRYNSTWEVAIANVPGVSRTFHVWLYDAFAGTNLTVRPGESHLVRATGFAPGADVTYRWERRDPSTGRFTTLSAAAGKAYATGPKAGWFEDSFRFPPSEARNIALCGKAVHDCYRILISGAGKQPETVNVQVGIADIQRSTATTPRPPQTPQGDLALQRSMNVSFAVDLYYPGGNVHTGPKLQPADLNILPTAGTNALRVAVEKVYRGNGSVHLLDEVPMTFRPQELVWRAQWTIPRNLTLETSSALYRLRLLEQYDVHGNRVVSDVLGNFTVSIAQLRPRPEVFFRELERTDEGILQLAVLYHDGQPFTPDDADPPGNRSPLRGCFVRVPPPAAPGTPQPPPVDQCRPSDPITWGRYDPSRGLWNFSVRYPRDYPDLDAHRFILANGTEDRYDNPIFAMGTSTFNVIPARPNVEFITTMRGKDAEVLERGNRVFVSATITYHDDSPYNHRVRVDNTSPNATVLGVRLLRRGPAETGYGPLAGEEIVNLTESDPAAGRWSGYLQLTDDDTSTPAGIWTFQLDIQDNLTVPNANFSTFDREVVSSTIVLCPTVQPPNSVATGTTIRFRFRLFYSECDTGREVPQAALVSKLSARVHRYDPARLTTVGAPVSNVLVPSFASDTTADWGIEYTVPDGLFAGAYVLNVTGADTFGNKLIPGSFSRHFRTFTEILQRDVVAQPAGVVQRGESATVVFDAREGDTGVDPDRPAPRIQLERFDTSSTSCDNATRDGGCWVRERLDVRVDDRNFEDHVGVFPVGVETPVGVYRFSLQGRDSRFHLITGLSGNFTVEPTLVTRSLLTTPPDRIIKGDPFTFYLEQMPGDQIRERVVFLDGRPIVVPGPQVTNEFGRVNITWAVPFDAPVGNYTLRLAGRDVYGNDILVLTPPIEGMSAELEGRLLGQPTRVVERGSPARILFAVAYPDGAFYVASDTPRVFVRNATEVVANAQVRREGLSFAAEWTPPRDTPLGDYYFEVGSQPTGGTGNAFPPLRSNAFKVVPGRVVRPAVDQIGDEFERLTGAQYGVGFEPNDKFVTFDLVYYGPSTTLIVDTQTPLPEITRSPIPHTIDVDGGKYVARLVTDQQSQTGTFRVQMTGEDAYGNRIFSTSRQFVIRPTQIGIQFDRFPPQNEFGEGKTITLSFVAKYAIGTLMDDSYGRPTAVVLYNERPVTQRPEIEYIDGHWYLTWTAPDVLPDGTYQFTIGGYDMHGNAIATSRSTPYVLDTSVRESFAKTVPGPSPLLLVVALAGIVALLSRRRK